LVGAGILPHGWAAIFGGDVSRIANRVVPLSSLDPDAASLEAAIGAGERPDLALEAWLGARIGRYVPDPRIARIFAMLDDPAVSRIETVAEALAMPQRVLAEFTRMHFGFTPKLLLRRGRFLRALSAVLTHPEQGPSALSAAGYWDRSHFLRDSHAFLGCSVRDFVKRRGPLNQVAMNVRAEVIGSPV
jgi:AraC-like DNA-binding protein